MVIGCGTGFDIPVLDNVSSEQEPSHPTKIDDH